MPGWQEVTGGSQATLHLTPAELRLADQEVTATIDRYSRFRVLHAT